MHTRLVMLIAACLLAPHSAMAQGPVAQGQPGAPGQPGGTAAAPIFTGSADFGLLLTADDGDEARYERYRDMRNGVFSNFRVDREHANYLFNARAEHVGYRDQQYAASFLGRRVTLGFDWTSNPLNFSYLTRTPYETNGGLLTLDDAAQAAVQGPTNATNDGTAVGVPCAPGAPPASCSTPANAALAKANRSIYNALADPFDLRYQRHNASVGLVYSATPNFDVDARFLTSGRQGQQPWGASYAFNNAVEIPLPLDQRTNDMTVGATWASRRAMFRLGWDGSWFNNNQHVVEWDNPIRLTDFNNGLLPPAGPYDASAYSNGNGAARGRISPMPGNMMNVVSATGLYRLARRTTVNGTLQLSQQIQDEQLIPWGNNSVVNTPTVWAAFPGLRDLPRQTADAEARGINALINLNTRPFDKGAFTVRYRYNERDVQTPTFDATEFILVDAIPEHVEEGLTHQFDSARHNFDANVSYTPVRWGTFRLGYGHEAVERHGRGFADVGENIVRLSFDAFTSQYFTVRAALDSGWRRGEGLVETHPNIETEDLNLIVGPAGTQPTLRYYDEADRDRLRGSLMLTVMPRDAFDFFVQFSGGRDKYLPDEEVPVNRRGELFGLQESDVQSWNVGLNFHPGDTITTGGSYGRERIGGFQKSRAANPPPDPSWVDPARDWTLDNADRINNVSLYVDLMRTLRNTDIRFGYDYSDSDNTYDFGGPRIVALAALNQFIPLPDVENTWHRASADVQYFFTQRAGVGFGYYFETFEIADWNTIDTNGPVGFVPATGEPRIDWLGGLTTGYGNRPYTGHSVSLRALYRF